MVKNSLQKKPTKTGLAAYMSQDAVKKQITNVVGGANGDRFISSIVSAAQANKQLSECSNASIVSAALLGHSLKLSPSPQLGQFYFVPFKNKKAGTTEAQFQIGYKGLIQLAMRSGQYKKLNVLAIKEGELVKYDRLEETIEVNFIDDEEMRESAETIGYYASFEYVNGFRKAMYWSKAKMLAHADKYAPAFSAKAYKKLLAGEIAESDLWKYSSFWYKDFDGMAYKTMLRQLISKWGIMSIDLEKAFVSDNAVIADNGEPKYEDPEDNFIDGEAEEVPAKPEKPKKAAAPKEEPAPANESFEDEFFNNFN